MICITLLAFLHDQIASIYGLCSSSKDALINTACTFTGHKGVEKEGEMRGQIFSKVQLTQAQQQNIFCTLEQFMCTYGAKKQWFKLTCVYVCVHSCCAHTHTHTKFTTHKVYYE